MFNFLSCKGLIRRNVRTVVYTILLKYLSNTFGTIPTLNFALALNSCPRNFGVDAVKPPPS